MKQWQARQESRDLSKVTIRGLLTRSSEGWWSGGMPPYGYDLQYLAGDGRFLMTVRYDEEMNKQLLDEDGNITRVVPRGESLALPTRDRCKLVPSTSERVAVVRRIFSWYVTEGLRVHGGQRLPTSARAEYLAANLRPAPRSAGSRAAGRGSTR